MDKYRTMWLNTAGAVLTTGFVLAVFLLPPAVLIWTGFLSAMLLPPVGAVIHAAHAPDSAQELLSKSVLAQTGVTTGLSMIALLGLIATLGSVAVQVPILLGLTCPAVMRRLFGRMPHLRPGPAEYSGDDPASAGPAPASTTPETTASWSDRYATLSESELCWHWRRSFTALQRAQNPAELARLSQTRRELLDELARRDPAGFERWLHNGARAASDPARYLGRTRR